jgi:hypothetical protein
VPDVTHDKDAGNIRFQKPWITIELPTIRPFAIAGEMWTGIDKATFIAFNDVRKPFCVWRGADHDE